MRLATVRTADGTRAAVIAEGIARILDFDDAGALLVAAEGGQPWDSFDVRAEMDAADIDFAPPVVRPEKVLCVGLNYRAHAVEAQLEVPQHPLLFPKWGRSLVGARDEILLPPETDKGDWEGELAVVIGRTVRRVAAAEALSAVAGYTVLNDVSMRDWQKHTSQFLPGKAFEASSPVGPWIVSPDELDHARDVELTCRVNGVVMQRARTSDMIFTPAEVIAYVSTFITLVPGDIIALGTPSGIGARQDPPVFLKPGDILETSVEGIGTLLNRVTAEGVGV